MTVIHMKHEITQGMTLAIVAGIVFGTAAGYGLVRITQAYLARVFAASLGIGIQHVVVDWLAVLWHSVVLAGSYGLAMGCIGVPSTRRLSEE